jgi:hypothetical protein
MCVFCYYVDGDSRLYRITRFFVTKVKVIFCSVVLGLHRVFFYSMSMCSNCFRFSACEILILKYLKKFSLSSFKRQKTVRNSASPSLSQNIINPIFSFSSLFFCKKMKPTCNTYHVLLTTIHANHCQEW